MQLPVIYLNYFMKGNVVKTYYILGNINITKIEIEPYGG
jgi:hypothetical protein